MLELKDIYKTYQMTGSGLTVLRDVCLKIEQGEFVSIMGPSGSGKSTLLNIIGLLDVSTSGTYNVCGKEITNLDDDELAILRRHAFGFVFQQFNLLQKMTALQNVELPLLYSSGYLNVKTAVQLLDRVGLGDRMTHRPQQLSGGQQQRVAIARSLANAPRIILADEPTGNLDSKSGEEILSVLKELNQQGITVILVTHEERIAKQADRLIRIHDGEIISDERTQKKTKVEVKKEMPALSIPDPSPISFAEFVEHFREGLKTLSANKVRTALSVLGILIGVAAVITMLALGTGAKKAIEKQLSSLGTNLLVLRPDHDVDVVRISMDDPQLIQQRVPWIKEVSPIVGGDAQVTYLDRNLGPRINGTSPSYARMHSAVIEQGRFFSEDENRSRSMVAVIGQTVVNKLFFDQNPIGEFIKINKLSFQVIGVLPERGA
ncbi:MAG: ABC transporter permease, partial [Pseudomonadota bacterium]